MQWIKPGTSFDFMGVSKYWIGISLFLVLASLAVLSVKGFDSGIDFKGGTKVIAEFKRDAGVERTAIKKAVDQLVTQQTGVAGTQVEVQDFDVGGAAGSDTVKYQLFTELPSLLTPIKKLEMAKALEQHFGQGAVVETPAEAGDKFYVTLPAEWPLPAAKAEMNKVFRDKGYANIAAVSDKEERIISDVLREKDLLMTASDDGVKAEAMKVEEEANRKIAALLDTRFTVEVEAIKDTLSATLKTTFGDRFVSVLSTASVSPSVGKELFSTGMLAMIYAIIGIIIYISLRFDMRFAPGALLCLIHDVIVVMGVMSLFDIKFTLTMVAAILTIIGYDINDTIIVYDRIRENLRKGKGGDMGKVINLSVNETLSRTIMTTLTTEFTLVAIWLLGGGTIKDFGFIVGIGVILGTYSSIFVAAPLTMYLERLFRKRALAKA